MVSKEKVLEYSKQEKMEIILKAPIETKEDFSLAYTPGIAEVCKVIQENPENLNKYTFRKKNLAVISDGSAVLGLGNIGGKASYPVMEGKCMIFKKFGDINAIPIILETQDTEEIINTIKNISSSFRAINLEDVAAPKCFEIEERLKEILDIPIMHDDQHGTAIVVLAALINAIKLTNKDKNVKIVIAGAGAAGYAITKLLYEHGFRDIIVTDSKGIISKDRKDLNKYKEKLLEITNKDNIRGNLKDAIKGADVFIGVSKSNLLTFEDVKTMNSPIVFALANPIPEIMPEKALKGGASIVGTGRSDFKNQINNALAFPGLFKGVIESGSRKITEKMKIVTAEAIVEYHKDKLSKDNLLPSILDEEVHNFISEKIKNIK